MSQRRLIEWGLQQGDRLDFKTSTGETIQVIVKKAANGYVKLELETPPDTESYLTRVAQSGKTRTHISNQ